MNVPEPHRLDRYSIGVASDAQTQPVVITYMTLRTAREDARARIAEGQRVLWLANINTGREHRI